jgi:HTH-type transcriptional regulator/antitoxin HigA
LWKPPVRFHFNSVDEVGKFNGILDEEDWNIVPDQIPITFLRVKFDGKPYPYC